MDFRATCVWQSKDSWSPHLVLVIYLLRVIRGVTLVVATILAAVGASKITPGNSQSHIDTGRSLTRVAMVLFMVGLVAIFVMHLWLWRERLVLPVQHLKVKTSPSNLDCIKFLKKHFFSVFLLASPRDFPRDASAIRAPCILHFLSLLCEFTRITIFNHKR